MRTKNSHNQINYILNYKKFETQIHGCQGLGVDSWRILGQEYRTVVDFDCNGGCMKGSLCQTP